MEEVSIDQNTPTGLSRLSRALRAAEVRLAKFVGVVVVVPASLLVAAARRQAGPEDGVLLQLEDAGSGARYMRIRVHSSDVVQVTAAPTRAGLDPVSLVRVERPSPRAGFRIEERGEAVQVLTEALRVHVAKRDGWGPRLFGGPPHRRTVALLQERGAVE